MIIQTVLFVALMTGVASISVVGGRIHLEESDLLKIKSGEAEISYEGEGVLPGYWFGLIEYKCTKSYGALVSKIECIDCGLYCEVNQVMAKCASMIPLISGILVSILLSSILTLVIVLKRDKIGKYFITKYEVLYNRYRDGKNIRPLKTMVKTTGKPANSKVFRKFVSPDPEICTKIAENRAEILNKVNKHVVVKKEKIHMSNPELSTSSQSNESYFKVVHELNGLHGHRGLAQKYYLHDPSSSDELYQEIKHEYKANVARNKPAATVALGLLALSALTGQTEACDSTLFISGTGRVCTDSKCSTLDTVCVYVLY